METILNNELIWFASEDFNHADQPYLPPLLSESFAKWRSEAAQITASDEGYFILVDDCGRRHGVSGNTSSFQLEQGDLNILLQSVISEAIRGGSPAVRSHGEFKVMAVPLLKRTEDAVFAVFLYAALQHTSMTEATIQACAMHYRSCFYYIFEQIYMKAIIEQEERMVREARRGEALLIASRKMYNQNDVSSVLSELLKGVEILYESSEAHLYLSQDHVHGDPRVHPLVFDVMAHDIIAEAFLNEKPVIEPYANGQLAIAVPLTGKQAAYGILKILIASDNWNDSDLHIIRLFADTAGSAFENAKLYEQSNMLIKELRLINEMTKRLNQSLSLKEIFQFATNELLSIFQADYCCILQLSKESDSFEVKASNVPMLVKTKFAIEYGFSGIVYRTKEPLIISDYMNSSAVSSTLMDNTDSRSLIAAPIFVEGEVIGVILIAHRIANYFSYENYKLLQVISTHVGLAIANASLHAEVRRMVITDNLTGLHARHYLNEQIVNKQRYDSCGSLILADIDLFKQINDTFGHLIGDEILVQVSSIIQTAIRSGDIAARWGGEELAIYLPKIGIEQARVIAERIRDQVSSKTNPRVTVSCGVSEWQSTHEKISVESLFYRADMALYDAKHKGRNRIVVAAE